MAISISQDSTFPRANDHDGRRGTAKWVDFAPPVTGVSYATYFGLAFIVILLKAVLLVQWGKVYGILSVPPAYDDVSYFVDAMHRVRIILDGGIWLFATSLVNDPPHSPYSTLAATISFLFMGPDNAGPYLMNGVALAAITALLFFLFRVRWWTALLLAFIVVTVKWFDRSVTIFHPDLLAGFGAAVIAAALLWQKDLQTSARSSLAIGAIAALVLLIKPVAFVMIIALWSIAWTIGALLWFSESRFIWPILRALSISLLPLAAIAGPYYVKEVPRILAYIYRGFVTEKDTWMHRPGATDSIYYLTQAFDLFAWLLPLAGISAVVVMLLAIAARRYDIGLRFGGLLVLCAFGYAIPALTAVKHEFYGGVFYGCVLVTALLSLHFLIDRLQPLSNASRTATSWNVLRGAVAGALVLAAAAGANDSQGRVIPALKTASIEVYDQVYAFIAETIQKPDNRQRLVGVYFIAPSPVAPHAFEFRALANNLNFEMSLAVHEGELKVLIDQASKASIVVIPDEKFATAIYPYPVMKLLPQMREWLRTNGRLRLAKRIETEMGGVDVFAERAAAP